MVSAHRPLVILSGPTASGKTALALDLARSRSDIEIINADSLLVYRGLNIGTAKPSREELSAAPHHLIDIRDPGESYTAADFARDAGELVHGIESRSRTPLIVGGTGFYLKALIFGVWEAPATSPEWREKLKDTPTPELHLKLVGHDSEFAYKIGPNDRYRIIRALEVIELGGITPSELEARAHKPNPRVKLLWIDREDIDARIEKRTEQMLQAGLQAEYESLSARYPGARPLESVGYAQVAAFLRGESPEGRKVAPGIKGLKSEIDLATRQLVKSQRTWFRGQFEAKLGDQCQSFLLDRDREKLLTCLAQNLSSS